MRYYPVNLDIKNRACLVIGGGGVGTRKVKTLVDCGAMVTVVSPEVSAQLEKMAAAGLITLEKRAYSATDLQGKFLVIGATDDEVLNRRIHADAEDLNTLCNIADRPEICNFILPAIVNRGDLVLAVSTSGKSPAYAKKMRKDLEKQFGEEYEPFLRLMGAIRERLLCEQHAPEAHKPLFEKLITAGLLDLIRADRTEQIDALLREVLGKGYRYLELVKNPGL
jgi:precorrin-2 dehydrogenase/sirohydrochlorin ferrochelatase